MTDIWVPWLPEDDRTLHERLVEAIRSDIQSGKLPEGARMPTHRRLAETLRIGIGTATKAYAEAERSGLLTSRVGRGTFVTGLEAEDSQSGAIDLSMNLPPPGPAASHLSETLARLRRRADLADCLTLGPPAGADSDRRTAALWLRDHARLDADWRWLLLCNGAQQAMAIALDALCRPGDTLLVEAVTFFGIRAIADYRGFALKGVGMDRHGILPDELDRAAAESGARIVYLQPTLHNPTARTMPRRRREEIAEIVRRRGLWVLEDDVYGALARDGDAIPLAELAPERCFYASSLSKSVAPGLRCGFLLTPDAESFGKMEVAMRSVCYTARLLSQMVAMQWIEDGTADQILAANAEEAVWRNALAQSVLGPALETPSYLSSLHIWLPMAEIDSERVAGRVLRQEVLLSPPSSFTVDGGKVSGLRVCLGALKDRASLETGLRAVAAALKPEAGPQMHALV